MRNIESKERRLTPAAMVAASKGNLKDYMAAITPGGIEQQEKAGQLAQAKQETLPFDLGQRAGPIEEARAPWEALGFRFGEVVDEIFVRTKFPDHWKKRPTDHSMWSEIVDDKGRVRGLIFYKAAFYDRRANARLTRRFEVTCDYASPLSTFGVEDACGRVVFKVGGLKQPDWSGDRSEADARQAKQDNARQICISYLNKNFPNWGNPSAYWL